VTVGSTFGWVNRLSARYISILTHDGMEHHIPNESVVTQEVQNWSYSDTRVRLHLPIGVSYASDLALVKHLLLQAADEHPRILKTPEPACLLTGFGDKTVDHELVAWISDPREGLGNVKSDL